MIDFLKPKSISPTPQQIASSLRRLGWIGFWLQALLGFIPLLVTITTILFRTRQQQLRVFSFGLWFAIACLAILIFSIYWCFRYTQLANKLESRELRPTKSKVFRDLKLGLVANLGIMTIAVLIALMRVGELTFKMLILPQGSTVIVPNQTTTTMTQGALIAPSNMIAIQAMVNAIAAGLIGTIVALLLLYQIGQHRNPQD
ncbi:hypothetical protein Sta7437_1653 [Stanieria cyanosphaera PCC 7437]|uniref:DUF3611 family protein n=1 Tax=Stanieria cyanosphaera (strain ATCC 29371 / PCC 7437) TaxID=111780 RepID=K9XT11_STAC7|nr:DUF3611 family protein [Stanieria cyanosphaera]AFZ35216.1 hypothetical protein Sta7437_1653 [Stanieria cyanosphaera PCC 7437]